jgi:AraC-like DNA-binding protein
VVLEPEALVPPTRHLLRARDTIDARYRDHLDVRYLAQVAHASPAHFIREFKRAFGETPHQYLLTRRMERAAALLSRTDYSVAAICMEVGLQSVGSFTSTFKRTYGMTPTAYRATYPPGGAYVPTCYWMTAARPPGKAFLEKTPREPALSVAPDDVEDRR